MRMIFIIALVVAFFAAAMNEYSKFKEINDVSKATTIHCTNLESNATVVADTKGAVWVSEYEYTFIHSDSFDNAKTSLEKDDWYCKEIKYVY